MIQDAYQVRRTAVFIASVCLVLVSLFASQSAIARESKRDRSRTKAPVEEASFRFGQRDSLRKEIERYSYLVESLRDSLLKLDESDELGDEQVEAMEESIAYLSMAVGNLVGQLSEIQVEVDGRRVMLRDGQGGEVSLDIPENLGENLGQGLSSLTRVILDEMPDTLRLGDDESGFTWSLSGDGLDIIPVAPPRPERFIDGGIAKFKDDLEIADDEIVLGDVVVVMGEAQIAGHVDGDVVVIMGDLLLEETACVDGEVITILGEQDILPGAEHGRLTAISSGMVPFWPPGLQRSSDGWLGFWGWQAVFVLLMLMVLLLLAVTPRRRLDAILAKGVGQPGESFGLGLLMALIGHLLLIGLGAILVLTVIGIPVAFLVLLAMALLDLGAVGVASIVVGRVGFQRLGRSCESPWKAAFVGMLILHFPAFLAGLAASTGAPLALVLLLAWTGRLVKFAAFTFGLGALLLSRFGHASRTSESLPPMTPSPGTPGA